MMYPFQVTTFLRCKSSPLVLIFPIILSLLENFEIPMISFAFTFTLYHLEKLKCWISKRCRELTNFKTKVGNVQDEE